jgi:hypothetical protein
MMMMTPRDAASELRCSRQDKCHLETVDWSVGAAVWALFATTQAEYHHCDDHQKIGPSVVRRPSSSVVVRPIDRVADPKTRVCRTSSVGCSGSCVCGLRSIYGPAPLAIVPPAVDTSKINFFHNSRLLLTTSCVALFDRCTA